MFNKGEIAIFRRAGLTPVFFGETLVGADMPNLTYMLVYEDMAAHDKQWSAFGADPEWKKLSTTPGYHRSRKSSPTSATHTASDRLFADLTWPPSCSSKTTMRSGRS